MFAPIYHCHIHGDIWHVDHTEAIDTDRDEVYETVRCALCEREVFPVVEEGVPVWHVLSQDEMDEDMWTDPDDEDEDYDDEPA